MVQGCDVSMLQSNNQNTVREFLMTPETVSKGKGDKGNLPVSALNNIDFEIRGQLDSTAIQMEQPLTGQSKYQQDWIPIQSHAASNSIAKAIPINPKNNNALKNPKEGTPKNPKEPKNA